MVLPAANLDQHTSMGSSARPACCHCGLECPDRRYSKKQKLFCCNGCLIVYELLEENGLTQFYRLEDTPGVRPVEESPGRFSYLDQPSVRDRLIEFSDGALSRVTFSVPSIHCIACIWLLENLFRLKPGIGKSQANFPMKTVSLLFDEEKVKLSELVEFLTSLGYEPRLNLHSLEGASADPTQKSLLLKLGVAGFAFGNIMLISLPAYFGLDSAIGPSFSKFSGYASLLLALPVLVYSASDYLKAALLFLRSRVVTIDLPIAMGIAALFLQSTHDILSRTGEGYLDSFAGLIFFLLCGRWFQQKTYDAISFERDYTSYFPLSVLRVSHDGEETVVPISELTCGDRIRVRNGELIPADARLINGRAVIDYSFVTGESNPVLKETEDQLYAGGRQMGEMIELEITKEVSQSYLTSLWNDEAFGEEDEKGFRSMTDQISERFTAIVLIAATCTCYFWLAVDPSLAVRAFSAVLIVACPCALALSAPFSFGSVLRVAGLRGMFIRNANVVEKLRGITHILFDKTGTMTEAAKMGVSFEAANALSSEEEKMIYSLVRHSSHPNSVRIEEFLSGVHSPEVVEQFRETIGCGIEGRHSGTMLRIGSDRWLQESGVQGFDDCEVDGRTSVNVAIDGIFRGRFILANVYREKLFSLIHQLGKRFQLGVVSGDRDSEQAVLKKIFGGGAAIEFNLSPTEKLAYVRSLQAKGASVLMIGDGLNDAGALKQSDVGMAITEDVGTFSPSCDIIMEAKSLNQLPAFLSLARTATIVVYISFGISLLYNLVGISFAAAGLLSPLVSAILMPLSSVTVVLFASGAVRILAGSLLEGEES